MLTRSTWSGNIIARKLAAGNYWTSHRQVTQHMHGPLRKAFPNTAKWHVIALDIYDDIPGQHSLVHA